MISTWLMGWLGPYIGNTDIYPYDVLLYEKTRKEVFCWNVNIYVHSCICIISTNRHFDYQAKLQNVEETCILMPPWGQINTGCIVSVLSCCCTHATEASLLIWPMISDGEEPFNHNCRNKFIGIYPRYYQNYNRPISVFRMTKPKKVTSPKWLSISQLRYRYARNELRLHKAYFS